MILNLFKTKIGRLRIIGFLEGLSLLILLLIALPLKYGYNNESLTKLMGPVHGALFLLFILNTVGAAVEQKWKVKTTAAILASCFVPFGTFYIDNKFLKNRE